MAASPVPAPARGGEPREAMLGEWIGVSLGRLFALTGVPADAGDADVAVLAAEVPPRTGQRAGTRAHPAVTIVKWRVFAHDKDQNADLAAGWR